MNYAEAAQCATAKNDLTLGKKWTNDELYKDRGQFLSAD